jgi:nucleotide-binding universal stress UspA family protein
MSKPIVVGVNEHQDSEAALHWAIAEAVHQGLPLLVLNVGDMWAQPAVSSGSLMERTRGQQVEAQSVAVVWAMNRDVQVSSVVVSGDPADVLASWSTEASMIVLGTRGRGPMTAAVRGSVSATVAARATCPVIVVPTSAGLRAPVVVGVDGSPLSRAAIEFALDYASRHRTWVRAVHTWRRSVLPGAGDLPAQRAAHDRVVVAALMPARVRYPHVTVRVIRTIGHADKVLADESMAAQLVVVGTRGHGAGSGLLLGSVSQSLLRTAICPVAVIAPKE